MIPRLSLSPVTLNLTITGFALEGKRFRKVWMELHGLEINHAVLCFLLLSLSATYKHIKPCVSTKKKKR